MYLRDARIVNDGPNADVALSLADGPAGPLPVVLVGENGAGKTNLLSLIADALIEGASQHHSDVVRNATQVQRPWWRMVGNVTVRRGAAGSFAILRFVQGDHSYFYQLKAGSVPLGSLPDDLAPELRDAATWDDLGNRKQFAIPESESREIFGGGCYAFFAADRSEIPHWLNTESILNPRLTPDLRIAGRLGKSMYIDRAFDVLSGWLSRLIVDSRTDFAIAQSPDGAESFVPRSLDFLAHRTTLQMANALLQIILDDDQAHFVWGNRFSGLEYSSPRTGVELPLAALSSGQAALLAVFGTVLMHCDIATRGRPSNSEGICVVDEIDAHVHVDLAFRAIPRLLSLLPKMQFILSAHSPLLVLGMQEHYGDDGYHLIELPSARAISSEGYAEFGRALAALRSTRTFDQLVADAATTAAAPLVLCEGETDPRYIRAASSLLGRQDVIAGLELDWIGTRDGRSGGSRGAGASNLDHAWRLLTENEAIAERPILLLYDNDHPVEHSTSGSITRIAMPTNEENSKVTRGIENLLDAGLFSAEMYRERTKDHGNGTETHVRELDKARLCDYACDETRNPQDFRAFSRLLDLLAEWRLTLSSSGPTEEPPLDR